MAAYISFQPSDYYNTKLYTGDGVTDTAITGVGFQPDFTWIKQRSGTVFHNCYDSARGVQKVLVPNGTDVEYTDDETLLAFGADGFTIGLRSNVNLNTATYASWNWKGGTTTGITTDGSTTITPSAYSFNQTSGFAVLAYTGNYTSGAKLAHGLGATPTMTFIKNLGTANDWVTYQKNMKATDPEDWFISLNLTGAAVNSVGHWNDTLPDDVNITLGNDNSVNGSSHSHIAYVFAPIKGYSKFGSYIGNANADGPFIYTGFRPAFVMLKGSSFVDAWNLWNDKTSTSGKNVADKNLQPNATTAEQTSVTGVKEIDIVSNGFKIRGSNTEINNSGETHIYAAFAEFPFVSSNSIPTVAR